MIRGVHTMFYTSEPERLRDFLRDKLGFEGTDVGEGWLIFDLPEAEMGCHPSEAADGARTGTHSISFYCDDLEKSVAALKARGVEFTDGITDRGFGLVTRFRVPGGFELQLYQPRYKVRRSRKAAAPAKPKKRRPTRTAKRKVKKARKR